jgi:omega-6 fatty acid desaturase (delta-12 desaturase)
VTSIRPPAPGLGERSLRADAARFQEPRTTVSLVQLATSLGGFVGSCALMYGLHDVSIWLAVAIAPVAAFFVVRLFIIQHDCGHWSYFRSRYANLAVGLVCSLFTLTPFTIWRRQHARHHGVWNDLDRRQSGADIYSTCLTVAEYRAMSPWRRRLFRLTRHPLIANVLVPPLVFLVLYRWPFDTPRSWRRERWGVHVTNLAAAGTVLALGGALGFVHVATVQLPVMWLASVIGVWLFSVQHRFDRVVWARHDRWNATDAALYGSSYLRLPSALRWLTGSIGLHHVHHLNPRIPNYRLQECLEALPTLRGIPSLSIRASLRALTLVLWDEDRRRMVTFRDAAMGKTREDEP